MNPKNEGECKEAPPHPRPSPPREGETVSPAFAQAPDIGFAVVQGFGCVKFSFAEISPQGVEGVRSLMPRVTKGETQIFFTEQMESLRYVGFHAWALAVSETARVMAFLYLA